MNRRFIHPAIRMRIVRPRVFPASMGLRTQAKGKAGGTRSTATPTDVKALLSEMSKELSRV